MTFLARGVCGSLPMVTISGPLCTSFSTSRRILRRSTSRFLRTLAATPEPSLTRPSKMCSVPMYSWLNRCASWFASCITLRARSVNRSYMFGGPFYVVPLRYLRCRLVVRRFPLVVRSVRNQVGNPSPLLVDLEQPAAAGVQSLDQRQPLSRFLIPLSVTVQARQQQVGIRIPRSVLQHSGDQLLGVVPMPV